MKSSLDTTQKIFISEKGRQDLFENIYKNESDVDLFIGTWNANKMGLYDYMFSAENLERYCLGRTDLVDYAYTTISNKLRKEYKQWLATHHPSALSNVNLKMPQIKEAPTNKYQRITKRTKYGNHDMYYIPTGVGAFQVFQELGKLEDLIEQGKLVFKE